MSACKAGCGTQSMGGLYTCAACNALWVRSPEWIRGTDINIGDDAAAAAYVDFCTRTRAERLNGRSDGVL